MIKDPSVKSLTLNNSIEVIDPGLQERRDIAKQGRKYNELDLSNLKVSADQLTQNMPHVNGTVAKVHQQQLRRRSRKASELVQLNTPLKIQYANTDNLIRKQPAPLEDKYFRDIPDSENLSSKLLRIELSRKESRNESNGG